MSSGKSKALNIIDKKHKKGLIYHIKKDYNLYLMILPVLITFFLFEHFPIIYNLFIGFIKYDLVDGLRGSTWVGFQNFRYFFQDPFFFRLIRNTFLVGTYSLLWGFPAPIIFALLLNEFEDGLFKRFTQSISYLPHFISTVVIVGILYDMFGFQGTINTIIADLGFEKIMFIDNPNWFRTLYVGSGVWRSVGWSSIVYMAAISGISPELYEAAIIDGAGRWKQTIYVTIPGILPSITILLIINMGRVMKVGFQKIFLMYSPLTYEVADVLQTYVYRRGIIGADFGYAGAVDFFNALIALILVVSANQISKKVSGTSFF